jgi:hypothetical protein
MIWNPPVLVTLVLVVLITYVDAAVTIRFTADARSRLTADARQTIERIATATEVEVKGGIFLSCLEIWCYPWRSARTSSIRPARPRLP